MSDRKCHWLENAFVEYEAKHGPITEEEDDEIARAIYSALESDSETVVISSDDDRQSTDSESSESDDEASIEETDDDAACKDSIPASQQDTPAPRVSQTETDERDSGNHAHQLDQSKFHSPSKIETSENENQPSTSGQSFKRRLTGDKLDTQKRSEPTAVVKPMPRNRVPTPLPFASYDEDD